MKKGLRKKKVCELIPHTCSGVPVRNTKSGWKSLAYSLSALSESLAGSTDTNIGWILSASCGNSFLSVSKTFPTLTISEGQMSGHLAKPKYSNVHFPSNDLFVTRLPLKSIKDHSPPIAGFPAVGGKNDEVNCESYINISNDRRSHFPKGQKISKVLGFFRKILIILYAKYVYFHLKKERLSS